MDLGQGHGPGIRIWTWDKERDRDLGQGHETGTRTWTWNKDMDLGQGTGTWTWTWNKDMDLEHGHGPEIRKGIRTWKIQGLEQGPGRNGQVCYT